MQKKRGRPGAGKRRRNLAPDQPGLSHARDRHTALAREEHVHSLGEAAVQSSFHLLQRASLNFEHPPRRLQTHCALQRRTMPANSFSRASSPANCGSGNAFGPSESAAAGLSCVSKKIPSTPAATPARASGSMNSGWPPLAWPCPPGSCTAWVISKTTGYPSLRKIGNARTSTTRFWYPKEAPRSVTTIFVFPALAIFSTTLLMSHGERNCPFFTFTARPVFAAATSKSVC